MKPALVIWSNKGDPCACLVSSQGQPMQMWRGDGMRFALEALKPLWMHEGLIELIKLDHEPHPFSTTPVDAFSTITVPANTEPA